MDVMEISYATERNGVKLGAMASLDPGEDVDISYNKLQRIVETELNRYAPHGATQGGQLWMRPDSAKPTEVKQAEWVAHNLGNGVHKLGNHLCCKVHGAAAVVQCNGNEGIAIALVELIAQMQALLCDLKKSA